MQDKNQKTLVLNLLQDFRRFFPSNGFTLIELLVVVLIIAILAAVAVPQYQKAVWKYEFQQWVPVLHAVYKAEQLYYAEHGHYTPDWRELAFALPEGTKTTSNKTWYTYKLPNGLDFAAAISTNNPRIYFKGINLDLYLYSGYMSCYHFNNEHKYQICRAIGCTNKTLNSCAFKLF